MSQRPRAEKVRGAAVQMPYWEYFLALEDDLIRSSRYVEFHTDNMAVFSIEFVRILLAASSEVDVVAKELCKLIAPSAKRENVNDYRSAIVGRFPLFHTYEIQLPRYSMHIDT